MSRISCQAKFFGLFESALAPAVADDAIAAARRLVIDLDERTAPLGDGLRTVSADTRQTLMSLRATLESIQALVGPEAPLSVGLAQTVTDLSRAARAVSNLADFLERNPSAVVFGHQQP